MRALVTPNDAWAVAFVAVTIESSSTWTTVGSAASACACAFVTVAAKPGTIV